MTGTSTSARNAAMRILLEDFEPLLARTEEAVKMLQEVRGELNADLAALGVLVQRTTDTQPIMMDAMKRLNGTANRIEAAMAAPAAAGASVRMATGGPKAGAIFAACLGSAVLSALLVGGGFYLVGKDTIEQARIGRALQSAWPSLDAGTREKVQGVLGK